MIDRNGYRANVGIIIVGSDQKLLWAKRLGQEAWQFPQGGVNKNESPKEAMFRELYEEIGLRANDVEIMAETQKWLRYRLPNHLIRHRRKPVCIGQKQKWFLLKLVSDESKVQLDASGSPEFDGWRWVNYWHPLEEVIFFKRNVYRKALEEFAPLLSIENTTAVPEEQDSDN